jgi:hypothetical protein
MRHFSRLFTVAWLLAVSAPLILAGCSGSGTTPAAPAANTGSANNNSLLAPASNTPVKLIGMAAPRAVDVDDRSPIQSRGVTATEISQVGTITSQSTHMRHFNTRTGSSVASARRTPKNVAINAPLDLVYGGGPVLSGAQSDSIFVNCSLACRSAGKVDSGRFLDDLFNDQYLQLLVQYLSSPGEIVIPGGKFEKGASVDLPFTYGAPKPGFTNPVITQHEISEIVLAGANALPQGDPRLVHIFNVLLAPNVDTCNDELTLCFSPDNLATDSLCGYHGEFTLSNGTTYLYDVVPWVTVDECLIGSFELNYPNQIALGNDPADAIYDVLSHETFEAITDPIPTYGWLSFFADDEMADQCYTFLNFVTLNHHNYFIQSEYSDIGQQCISATLTNGHQLTP